MFRQEALDAQHAGGLGEIVLIRPVSFTFSPCWPRRWRCWWWASSCSAATPSAAPSAANWCPPAARSGARAAGRHRAAQVRPGRPGGTTRRAPDGAFQRTLRQRCRPGAGRYQQAPGTTPRLPARRTGKASPPARRRARQPDQQGRQPAARTHHPRRPDRQPATPAGAGQRRRRALPGADGQGLHLHGPVAATPGRAARPAPDPARPGARTHVVAAAVDRAPQRTRRAFRAPGQPARGNPPPAQRGGAGPGRKRSQAHLAGHRAGERHRHRRARRSRADRRQLASAAEHRSRRHPVAGRTLRAEQVHRFHPAGRRGADPLPGLSVPEVRPVPRQVQSISRASVSYAELSSMVGGVRGSARMASSCTGCG